MIMSPLYQKKPLLWEVTKKLMVDIELGKQMDASIEAQIEEAKIKGIEQEKK